MDEDKSQNDTKPRMSASAASVGVGTAAIGETGTQQVSLGRKILYHLWDADQHLKSPEVSFDNAKVSMTKCLTRF